MFRAQDLRVNAERNLVSEASGKKSIDSSANVALGLFPFVRTNRPVHSRRNENFIFNQSYPFRPKEIAETLGERRISVSK